MLPVPFRAVLFDLDGTLLYTLKDIADSTNRALARFGFPQHELGAYRYFVGDGSVELARRALPGERRDEVTLAAMVAAIDEEYANHWADSTLPYEGIPELLDTVSRLGLRAGILSNKDQGFTELSVRRFLARWRFDAVVGARPGVPRKPDPTGALQIARQVHLAPGDFLYLGDTATDMRTAVAAGMYPVGALWGFRTADELKAAGAELLARLPADILPLIQ